jgi:hypothetical protein
MTLFTFQRRFAMQSIIVRPPTMPPACETATGSPSIYEKTGNYEEVARRTKLDRRTVKKYVSDA